MRLFIAVPLPKDARRVARDAQAAMLAAMPAERPVPLENMHITLRFLGETTDIVAAAAACREAVRGIRPFPLLLTGYDCFRRGKGATAVLRVEQPTPELGLLHDMLESALCTRGFPMGRKGFAPHVTLARGVDAAAMETLPPREAYRFTADRIVLYESRSANGRMVYAALHEERL